MTTDLVSNMLTCIRNASLAKHSFTQVNYSKLNLAILRVLLAEKYIQGFEIGQKNQKPVIRVFLKYKGWWIKKSFFSTLKRISKPGNRVFCGYKQFEKVIDVLSYQQGTAIISTSSGVMSHVKAKKLRKGGELLCYVG